MKLRQTPSQTVGPFFEVGLTSSPMNVLDHAPAGVERMRLEGTVFDGAGAAVPDAMIEIWQAGHARDGFARAGTDAAGSYFFETMRPRSSAAAQSAGQSPHLNVAVFARGMLLHAFTRVYFGDDAQVGDDPLLSSIDPARRHTLIATRRVGDGHAIYVWDIRLQGERETVFLDL
jgi:protocatechuate 3,4-dioxygenase alpha subunit